MKRVFCNLICAVLLILLLSPGVVLAQSNRPMAMSEVNKMLVREKKTTSEVLEVMAERGVAFKMSSASEKRLLKYGFSEDQIAVIARMAKGEKVDLTPPTDGPDEAGDEAGGEFRVGYPHPQGEHAAEKRRMSRSIEASVGYKRIELQRCTLYCSAKRHAKLLPMLKKLEAELISRFPESICNASSPDSSHIVIIDGHSQWHSFVDAFFDTYAKDGIAFQFGPEADARVVVKEGSGMYFPMVGLKHADKADNEEEVARFAAYSVGHLMMQSASGESHPHGLRTGFANLAESMAFKKPALMVASYAKRSIGDAGGWAAAVSQRFRENTISTPTKIWAMDTQSMQAEHYAECWSHVLFLAKSPEKFAQAVGKVRNGEMRMDAAVREVYGVDDKKLMKAWYKSAK